MAAAPPLFHLLIIIPLTILAFLKHSTFTKWTSFVLSILLMILPFFLAFVYIPFVSIYCYTHYEIGPNVLIISSVFFLISALLKIRIPVETTAVIKNDTSTDTIDNF